MNAPRNQLKAVKEVLESAEEPPIDDFDGDRGDDHGGEIRMPAGCPVEPLGTENNQFYFLTALGELRSLAADKVANKHIVGMFAPFTDYLFDKWPRMKEVETRDARGKLVKDAEGNTVTEWIVTGWRADDVSMLLMRVAAAKGVWNARDKVRGRGAHRDGSGQLILHCGNHVLAGGSWAKPGVLDGMVYPTAPAIPKPGPAGVQFAIEVDGEEREVPIGIATLHWLRHWSWARPGIDPMLALGWIAIARLGGAIAWRPTGWLTGGAGEGKSTLMDLIGDLFDCGLLKLEATSEAAVRQLLGQDTLPVVLDEQESEEDDRQMQAIIKLARIAASGGNVGKGGSDHVGHQFTARSCFLFSSILIPPLLPADKSRMAVLELKRLPPGAREPRIVRPERKSERQAMCAAITRRMVDNWGRWERTFEAFSDALIDYGKHRGRGAKVFASLLAAAHIMLDDDPPEDAELIHWGQELAVSRLAELADNDGDDRRVIQHLGTCLVQLAGSGSQRLVSEWVQQAVATASVPGEEGEAESRRRSARDALARIGIGIFVGKDRKRDAEEAPDKPLPVPGRQYLVIANAHQGLGKLFAESGWKGRAGASGVWSQSLKRIEGSIPNERQRIGGVLMACTLVPIEAMWGDDTASAEAKVAQDQTQEVDGD